MTTISPRARALAALAAAALAGTLAVTYATAQHPGHGQPGSSSHSHAACDGDCQHGKAAGHDCADCKHGKHGAGGCPLMGMQALADVSVENTKNGAVIRLEAKQGAQVTELQQKAQALLQHMRKHADMGMGMGHEHAKPAPAPAPKKPAK